MNKTAIFSHISNAMKIAFPSFVILFFIFLSPAVTRKVEESISDFEFETFSQLEKRSFLEFYSVDEDHLFGENDSENSIFFLSGFDPSIFYVEPPMSSFL